jgi:hypothetical protein
MASLERLAGFSNFISQVYIQDSSTGGGKTGLTNSTVTCYYKRDTDAASTLVTLDAITTLGVYQVYAAGHGGLKEIDATNMPGHYEFHAPNAAVGVGAGSVAFNFRATGAVSQPLLIGLNAVNNQSSTAFVSSVPTVAGTIGANLLQVNGVAVAPDPTAQAGAASTITLASADTSGTNAYVNRKITITGGTGIGQSRYITAYVSSTKVATVDHAWDTTPDATSTYALGDTAATSSSSGGAPTAAQVATAVWQDATSGDFTTANSIGHSLFNAFTAGTSVFTSASLVNAPTGSGGGASAAAIATAIFQDLLASTDFQTANSVGLALANMLAALGSDHKPLLSAATHTGSILPVVTTVTSPVTIAAASSPAAGVTVVGSTASAVTVSGLPSGRNYVGQHLYHQASGEDRTIADQSYASSDYTFTFGSGTGEAGPFSVAPTTGDLLYPVP